MARTAIPTGIADAEIYIDGSNSLAGIAEVELPNVEFSTVTAEQIGMNAEYEAALLGHFKKLECKIKMDSVNDSMLGLNNGDSLMVEAKAALQQENTLTRRTEVLPLDATISGIIKKIDGIKVKSGAKIESNFELSVNYYKLTIGGRTVIELDVFNRISNVNGKTNDTIRRILGLL